MGRLIQGSAALATRWTGAVERGEVSGLIVRAGLQPDQETFPLTAEAAILDADGAMLTEVGWMDPPRDGCLIFGDIDEPDVLLGYYFRRGGRQIMMDLVVSVLEGRLETRWDGDHRSWWIEFTVVPRSG